MTKKYKTPIGIRAIINNGVPMVITIMAPNTLTKHKNQFLNISGTWISIASTSFENLFIILPSGVVSKKHMGDLRTPSRRDR